MPTYSDHVGETVICTRCKVHLLSIIPSKLFAMILCGIREDFKTNIRLWRRLSHANNPRANFFPARQ